MDALVLDTDVCSFLFKRNSRAERYRPHLHNKTLCLSFQTVAELYQGAEQAHWSMERLARLEPMGVRLADGSDGFQAIRSLRERVCRMILEINSKP